MDELFFSIRNIEHNYCFLANELLSTENKIFFYFLLCYNNDWKRCQQFRYQ